MKEKKRKDQSIEALVESLNTLRKEKNVQDMAVRLFQALVMEDGLSSQTIREFIYPMVIFRQDGAMLFASNALTEETGLYIAESSVKKHNILNRITDSNFQILDAVEDVFSGKTSFLTNLFDPLAMFTRESSSKQADCSKYQCAIFFPIAEDGDQITHGAVIFIK